MSRSTLDWYEERAETFSRDTIDLDLADLHDRFLAGLAPGAHILDAGCGSGRDSRAFLGRGFRVSAYDGSSRMAELASRQSGIPVATRCFREVDEEDAYDGIWASASFLHVPRAELPEVFSRHLRALRPGGRMYCSMKEGEGERHGEDGRLFTLVSGEELSGIFRELPDAILVEIWRQPDRRPERPHEYWLNALVRRRSPLDRKAVPGGTASSDPEQPL